MWLLNWGCGHQLDWLTVCQRGQFREFLVATVIIQDPQRYSPGTSDQGPGYIVLARAGFRTSPVYNPRGISNSAITAPSHCAGITWSLATTRLEGDNSSSARRSIWRPTSRGASYAPKTSTRKMNSFMILAKNAQIFSGRCPSVCQCQENFLQDGRASPDTVCSV
jgi:hypothetical protein